MFRVPGLVNKQDVAVSIRLPFRQLYATSVHTLCDLARHEAQVRDIPVANLTALLEATAVPFSKWISSSLVATGKPVDAAKGTEQELSALLFGSWVGREGTRLTLDTRIHTFIALLFSDPRKELDWGGCLRETLVKDGALGFAHMYGVTPSSGYARPYLLAKDPISRFPSQKDSFRIPNPGSTLVTTLATHLMLLDSWKWQPTMFSPSASVGGFEARDKMFGLPLAILWILRRVYVFALTYRIAAIRLLWGMNRTTRDAAEGMWDAINPGVAQTADALEALSFVDGLPTHSLGHYLESFLKTASVEMLYGDHAAIVYDSEEREAMD